jgi:hypothetical protein
MVEKRYFGEVAPAVKVAAKRAGSGCDVYWGAQRMDNGRFRVWHPLSLIGA